MFGKHAAYIIPSYGITALVIIALIVWIMMTWKQRRNEIADLEQRGITRGASSKKSK